MAVNAEVRGAMLRRVFATPLTALLHVEIQRISAALTAIHIAAATIKTFIATMVILPYAAISE
jgi:hypothetical protein